MKEIVEMMWATAPAFSEAAQRLSRQALLDPEFLTALWCIYGRQFQLASQLAQRPPDPWEPRDEAGALRQLAWLVEQSRRPGHRPPSRMAEIAASLIGVLIGAEDPAAQIAVSPSPAELAYWEQRLAGFVRIGDGVPKRSAERFAVACANAWGAEEVTLNLVRHRRRRG